MPESVADRTIAARQERAHRGAAQCRRVLDDIATERGLTRAAEELPRTEAEVRLDRARARAARERRAQRLAEP